MLNSVTRKNPFSIMVMTTHGRAGLSRWVHASVAEYVVMGVSSPILLIGPQEFERKNKGE